MIRASSRRQLRIFWNAPWSRKPFVEKRREVYLKLGRRAEAEADEHELKANGAASSKHDP